MGKKRVMLPATEVDMTATNYTPRKFQAPRLTGFLLKLFVMLVEAPIIGSTIIIFLTNKNRLTEMLKNTVIPEASMFIPEFPQEPEPGFFFFLEEDGKLEDRVELALQCLPDYNPGCIWITDPSLPFRYWKIHDYAYAYRVAEHFISAIEESNNPPALLLISFDPDEVRRQAAASTLRFKEGGTTWFHAVCVSRLRHCVAVLVGKTNMHELALGTIGDNANFGTTRNPHAPDRYTGGSSSGSAAIVASGLCSAALGTDGGGSIRIPPSLCGVVGLKTTHGRTDMKGLIYHSGTVAIVGPITATVEDGILVYAAILGSSKRVSLNPCFSGREVSEM
ncbi:unnamed protein product [Withania somnifera]